MNRFPTTSGRRWSRAARRLSTILSLTTIGIATGFAATGLNATPPPQQTVGEGFTISPSDLKNILHQIKISEYHVAHTTSATGPCGALIGPGPDQIASPLISGGLRTVDGSCNNLQPGQETYGSADQAFPRLTTPSFRPAQMSPPEFGPPHPTSYAQTSGSVFDSDPRMISNLIVDQTASNPAAVAAAAHAVRSQGGDPVVPCDSPGNPAGCTPAGQTLFIPNVTTDVGLSPPYNSLFTIFGQFFDHGLDKITNGGNGTVFVPLAADDPLIVGPDGEAGTADDPANPPPPGQRFMVLTRGTIKTGPDGFRSAPNTDSPFVDQSQTYTSHPSHQVFLREYTMNSAGHPVSTGELLQQTDGGMATWALTKQQAAEKLGLKLVDMDVNNIPMMAVDPYGRFIPGPNGLPQYVTDSGLVEGDLANPVPAPADVKRINTAFLNDIAHSAVPTATPDADNVAGTSLDTPAPGEYDDELLDEHFIAGDGRVNENIGLTAVHQIFHSEHDRLVGDIKQVLLNDTSGQTSLSDWQTALGASDADGIWNGERLFQAARFVTEMEYQHLVFEEFARKVQPAINPFQPFAFNQTDLNPAITAEFAHAVYRFGHSMLDDTLPRINADGSTNDIDLFDGFLNPAAYQNGGSAGHLDSQAAAGSLFMGLADQTGNELDEFVADTLRNRLLGLPLDLPVLNMVRARSEGIPTLNNVRRQIHAATNDGQMAPYTSWVDFGNALKHPESLINFVAAYGHHPSILTDFGPDGQAGGGDDGPATLKSRRAAAKLIVNPALDDVPPADAADFMYSTGPWANDGNVSTTGLDDVDLWVGGLAEHTNLFGGLLGSTFNYVFEKQLTDLQNGDRLYYLARTPGMNLRAQLEGNSFSELVMRNTDAHTLKADPFATADCKFEIGRLTFPASPGSFLTGAGSVNDDSLSECNDNRLLQQMPNGTVRYRPRNSVDPSGINAQSVYNGTDAADRMWGGNDNDTFWGGKGADIIEGDDGADVALGGAGNDIITDSAGDDVPKGGPGNDAIDAGPGLDIIMGGDGSDFTNGGANINETFAGAGNDFTMAGQGEDAVFGDSGNDWQEGGDQPDLLQGDSGSLFFDDHNRPGHDILIGQSGDDDYDMEGGDDIGVAGPGIEKVAGASGFDWETGVTDPQPQDADLALPLLGVPLPINAVRDRFNEVEALSGGKLNDTLRGDSIIPSQVAGGGFIGCDALDQAGLDRISGLDPLVPPLTVPSQPIIDASVTQHCMLTGNVWGEGNILLGGAGTDLIEGRGADDIIDGDRYLNVRLSVRTDPADPASETGTTDLMEHAATTGHFGPGTAGMTLQAAVFAGLVDPGNIVAVREVITPAVGPADCSVTAPANCDTALFTGALSEYTVTVAADGTVTVDHNGGVDGIDTVRNVELLKFADQTIAAPTPQPAVDATNPAAFASQVINTTSGARTVTITNTGVANLLISGVSLGGANPASFTATADPACSTLVPGASCSVTVTFTPTTTGALTADLVIASNAPNSPTRVPVSGTAIPVPAPALGPLPGPQAFGNQALTTTSAARVIAISNTGTAALSLSSIALAGTAASQFTMSPGPGCTTVAPAATCNVSVSFRPTTTGAKTASLVITHNAPGSPSSVALSGTGVVAAPSAPTIGAATRGNTTATVRWSVPASTGGSPITGYSVRIYLPQGPTPNVVIRTLAAAGGATTSVTVTGLLNGTSYNFDVRAVNAVGTGAPSARSNTVTPATVPGTPGIGIATAGTAGGAITATARWAAPGTGGSPITGYVVRALRIAANGTVLSTTTSAVQPAAARLLTMTLPVNANYRFTVQAINAVGSGAQSAQSNLVRGQ